ncbi:MAG: GntR family transcriptional regulator [Labedaea sp.]
MLSIEPDSSVPPYEQVRTQLAGQINDGTLAVGTRLPTVRALAAELGLAANTVARAYRELEDAGLVDTRGRAGTFVSATGDRSRAEAARAAREYAASTRALGLAPAEALRIVAAALNQ